MLGPHVLTKLISREMPRPEGLAAGEDHLILQLQPISLWGVWRPKEGGGVALGREGVDRKARRRRPQSLTPHLLSDVPPPSRTERAAATGAAQVASSVSDTTWGGAPIAEACLDLDLQHLPIPRPWPIPDSLTRHSWVVRLMTCCSLA